MNFYPRPPRGGRRSSLWNSMSNLKFLSTPSARRATVSVCRTVTGHYDFYPRPPRGGRLSREWMRLLCVIFLSTPSARRATLTTSQRMDGKSVFLSTPSARRATVQTSVQVNSFVHFYPRPPRGGRRRKQLVAVVHNIFLSTPSARRATVSSKLFLLQLLHFYPRPPRGGRPACSSGFDDTFAISIHALREEGDR